LGGKGKGKKERAVRGTDLELGAKKKPQGGHLGDEKKEVIGETEYTNNAHAKTVIPERGI